MIIHPKFRGIGLGAFLVRETMSRVDVRVIEALAVMAKYNPFFEKAGMIRVNYRRDESSIENKISESKTELIESLLLYVSALENYALEFDKTWDSLLQQMKKQTEKFEETTKQLKKANLRYIR